MENSFSTRPFIFDAQPPRARPRALRPSRVLLLIAVMLWSSSVACLWTNESRLIFQAGRSRSWLPIPEPGLIQLTTTDGIRLDARSLTHDRASAYWILFCPPSGRSIHGRVHRHLESLHAAGYNVFAFDYRGFGRNAGTPSEAGVYRGCTDRVSSSHARAERGATADHPHRPIARIGRRYRAGNARSIRRAPSAERDRFGTGDRIALVILGTRESARFAAFRLDGEGAPSRDSRAPGARAEGLARPDRRCTRIVQAISGTQDDAGTPRRPQ